MLDRLIRTTGGVIPAVTAQGSNRFRGGAFGYVPAASLSAETYFVKKNGVDTPQSKQWQLGSTIDIQARPAPPPRGRPWGGQAPDTAS